MPQGAESLEPTNEEEGTHMIRIGLIGAGKNGRGNVTKLANDSERCRIAAVADLDEQLAAEAAEPFGAAVTTDFTAFLDDVDAVVVSSPNYLHADHAVTCAEAGKHVWIEKPMAITVADADRIVQAVEKAGVQSFVGFSVRFDAAVRTMRRKLDDGVLGSLVSLWSRRMSYSPPGRRGGWRGAFSTSGGHISELQAHEIDWILDMAGMPDVVFCRLASRYRNEELDHEHVWLTMGFGDSVTGTVEGSQMAPIADYYRGMVGEEAAVYTQQWGKDVVLQKGKDQVEQLELLPRFDKHAHFLDVIEGSCESVADVRCGRRVVRVTEKALESARTGRAVSVQE